MMYIMVVKEKCANQGMSMSFARILNRFKNNDGVAEYRTISFVVAALVVLFSVMSAAQGAMAAELPAGQSILSVSGSTVKADRFGRLDVYDVSGRCVLTRYASSISLDTLGVGTFSVRYSGVAGVERTRVELGVLSSL